MSGLLLFFAGGADCLGGQLCAEHHWVRLRGHLHGAEAAGAAAAHRHGDGAAHRDLYEHLHSSPVLAVHHWKQLLWPGLAATVTNWVGIQILQNSADTLLRRVLGVVLMALAVYFIFFQRAAAHPPHPPQRADRRGGGRGLTGRMFSIGGPPIVAYYLNALDDKREYTATTQMFLSSPLFPCWRCICGWAM